MSYVYLLGLMMSASFSLRFIKLLPELINTARVLAALTNDQLVMTGPITANNTSMSPGRALPSIAAWRMVMVKTMLTKQIT